MHTLEEIRAEYDRLDRLCGVDTRQIRLGFSRRAARRLGSFRYGPGGLSILIADRLRGTDAAFWDTVRHEYAHAVVHLRHPNERHGHDAVWRAVCREVGCAPERLAQDVPPVAARYLIRCLGCGQESRYLRAGKAVQLVRSGRPDALRCTVCGGTRFSCEELR